MNPALVLDKLTVDMKGRTLLYQASATFEAGTLHAVVGRSGAGKSVLLKSATGLLPLKEGQVHLPGLTAHAHDLTAFENLRRRMVFVHQDPALLDELTIEENLYFTIRRRTDISAQQAQERMTQWTNILGISDCLQQLPAQVSPGQQRCVAILRALCTTPEILVLDEPTTGLDPKAARDVDRALLQLMQLGTTLIIITHDLRSLRTLEPRITFVEQGQVLFQGSMDDPRIRVDHPILSRLIDGGNPVQ